MVRLRGCFIATAVSAILLCGRASAQTSVTWIGGGGSGDATLTVNWLGGIVPVLPATVYNATFGAFTLNGNVTINGGATVTLNNVSFSNTLQAYSFSGSSSPTLVINGALSTVANEAAVTFGNSVNLSLGNTAGTFTLGSGSQVQVNSAVSGGGSLVLAGSGTLTLASSATYTGGTDVEGSTTMQVVSGGSLNGTTALNVGYEPNDNATLAISGGGTVTMGTGPLTVGDAGTATGTLSISGTGSTLTAYSTTPVIGNAGTGTLSVSNHGTFNGSDVEIGYGAGSTGNVTVDGSGSLFNPTNTLYVGTEGSGTVAVTNGGSVTTSTTFIGDSLGSYGGSGNVTVDGAGSSFANGSGLFYLGDYATGSITVTNGGTVSSVNSVAVGVQPGSTGTLTLATGGTATIGGGGGVLSLDYGTATLNIGAASGSTAAPGGALNAAYVAGYGTNDTVQFNTTATSGTPYYFTKDGTSETGAVEIQVNTNVVNTAGYNILSGDNSYTGATTVNGGTLAAGYANNAFGYLSAVTTGGTGVLALNGFDEEVGSISGSSGGINLGSNTLYIAGSATTTYGGLISGAGGNLNAAGTGTLTLTNVETYSGNTTIGGDATLQLGNGTTSGNVASATIADYGTLALDESASGPFSQAIVGSGGVTVYGPYTTTLSGNNLYTGATSVVGGNLKAGSSDAFGNLSAVSTSDGGMLTLNGFSLTVGSLASFDTSSGVCLGSSTLTIGGSATTTYEGVISGSGSLIESGTGTQILANTNTYSGGTTINSGATLQLGNGGSAGSVEGNIVDNGLLAFDNPGSTTFSSVICGAGGVTIQGGMLTFDNAETYTGLTTINCMATLQLGDGDDSGSVAGNVVDNGTLTFDNLSPYTFSGNICGTGAVNVNDGTLTLSGSNTYSGTTSVNNGSTLKDSGAYTLSASSLISLSSEASLVVGSSETINGISGNSGSAVSIASEATLTTTGTSCDSPFDGVISGCGALTIGTDGYLTLTNTNTYTGGTTIDCMATLQLGNGELNGSISGNVVNSGTLLFDASECTNFPGNICGNGAVTVESGMVTLSGSNSYYGATSVTGSAELADGAVNAFSPNSLVSLSNCASLVVNNNESIGGLQGASGTTVSIASEENLTTTGTYDDSPFQGVISGNGALTIGTNGYLTLTNTNTYTGGTTIDCMATLQLGDGDTNGTIAGNVTNSGTLLFDASECTTFPGNICGNGAVTVGSGMVTLSGSNTYYGATSVTGSAELADGAVNAFSPNSLVSLSNCASLVVNNNESIGGLQGGCNTTVSIAGEDTLTTTGTWDDSAFMGVISGNGALTIGTNGFLTLTNANTYSGGTTIDCMATLQLGDGENNGSIVGNVTDNGTLEIDNSGCITLGGVISGSGGLTLQSGMVTLSGSNSYSGATYIEGGSLFVTNSAALGNNSGVFVGDSESLPVLAPSGGPVALSNPIAVPYSGLALNTNGSTNVLTLNGSISNYGDDYGTLVINGPVVLNGSNSFSGGTTIYYVPQVNGGVTLGTDSALGTGSVTATGSYLNFTSASPVIHGLSTVNTVIQFAADSTPTINDLSSDNSETTDQIILGNGAALTIGEGTDPKYYGTISGAGSVAFTSLGGGAELDLEGTNNYSGGTIVEPGALLVADNSSALGTGTLTLNNGSAFGVNSGITITNQVVNNGGSIGGYGTIAPALPENLSFGPWSGIVGGRGLIVQGSNSSHPIIGTLTVGSNASVDFAGGSGMQFSITDATQGPGTGYSTINFGGNVTFDSSVSPTSQFTISIIGVDSTGVNSLNPYTAVTFDTTSPGSWTLMTASSISFTSGFNASDFNIDTSNFLNSTASHFYVTDTGTSLMLNFTPVPEPSTWALMIGGICVLAGAAVRRRRRA